MDSHFDIDSADKIEINNLTKQFFNLFDNTEHKIPDWPRAQKICIPEIIIIKKTGLTEVVYNLTSFIDRAGEFFPTELLQISRSRSCTKRPR